MIPEQRLWRAVLLQAIKDAERGNPEAITWLRTNSRDLGMVCDMAGEKVSTMTNTGKRRYTDKRVLRFLLNEEQRVPRGRKHR
jgi:hypothetical protein